MATCHPDRKHVGRGLCRSCYGSYYSQTDAFKANQKRYKKGNGLARKYGLTLVELDALRKNGKCHICGADSGGRWKALNIDHDHKTGKVRGLLCGNCNNALGHLKDSPQLARKAAEYLERFDSVLLPQTVHNICIENYV